MNILVWLILVASVNSSPGPEARRFIRTTRPPRESRERDILKALTLLLSEPDTDVRMEQKEKTVNRNRIENKKDKPRQGKQFDGFVNPDGECEVTGFETKIREECEEVNEIKCENVKVTKTRSEIVPRCKTLFDQICNITYNDVPTQKCTPKTKNRCETEYRVVEDKIYKEECKVDVSHICEEHITVPVEEPYPVKEPYPHPPVDSHYGPHDHSPPDPYVIPPDHPHPDPFEVPLPHGGHYLPHPLDLFISQPPDLHVLPPRDAQVYDPPFHSSHHSSDLHSTGNHPIEAAKNSPAKYNDEKVGRPTSSPRYAYDPTPGSKFLISPTPNIYKSKSSPLLFALSNQSHARMTRQKRQLQYSSDRYQKDIYSEVILKEIVKQVLFNIIENNQELGEVKATIKQARSIDPVNYQFQIPSSDPHQRHPDHHTHDHHSLPPDVEHDSQGHHHSHPPDPEYPPIITTHELPAPPGCRSIATKECHKIPVIIPRKVPYEVCNKVPDIDCVRILKSVPELQCTPEAYRECNDVEKKIPYLVDEEECEEITFDECAEIEEKIPVEVCKRKRLNENSITINKGKPVRKEGEKRRTPAFRRASQTGKDKDKQSSSSSTKSTQTSSSTSTSNKEKQSLRLLLRDFRN